MSLKNHPRAAEGARRHFLAYTAEGCVTSRGENEDHRVIEVAFHNLHARKRVPHLSDFFGFTLAALADRVRRALLRLCDLDSRVALGQHWI